MIASAERLIAELMQCFGDWRFEDASELFHYPMAIYTPAGLSPMMDKPTLRRALSAYRSVLKSVGVTDIHGEVVAVSLPRGQQVQVYADWHCRLDDGPLVAKSRVIYYCKRRPQRGQSDLKIEMMDYQDGVLQQIDAMRKAAGQHSAGSGDAP